MQNPVVVHEREVAVAWWGWVLVGIGVVAGLTIARELPALRRYLKMRSM